MLQKRFDVMIDTAGCLLWLAPRSFGGHSPKTLSEIWMGGGPENITDLIARGAIMPLALYQDDGYSVRFVQGELAEQEQDEWTAHACMNLNIPCGELLVSGVLTPDFEEFEFPRIEAAEPNRSTEFGCYLQLQPGSYRVDVYSYPPGDLSAAWGHIVDSRTFGKHPGLQAEKALPYFERTRPGESPPAWLKDEDDETFFVNFLVQISAADSSLPPPELAEDDFGVAWQFRKPDRCPRGLPLDFRPE